MSRKIMMRMMALGWMFASCLFAQDDVSLRSSHAECGLYFTDYYQSQGHKVSDLNKESIEELLKGMTKETMATHLALVGVPPKDSEELRKYVTETLTSLGYKDVPLTIIRRLSTFIASETGLFINEGKVWRRLADAEPTAMRVALEQIENPERFDYLVVGIPSFGDMRKQVEGLLREQGLTNSKIESGWKTWLRKAWSHPLQAATHGLQSMSYFFPIKEDFVPASPGEFRSAMQKIIVPGLLTFSIMLTQDQPLAVLVPVTLMNAVNSFSNGYFRSSVGNWWRRSTSFFPSQYFKNVTISSFFTATLYWSGRASLSGLTDALTVAGWTNFISGKWLSILFQTLWRTPIQNAIFSWEERKLEHADEAKAIEVHQAASAIEKYISYIMTQFYIYSVISHQSLFDIVQKSNGMLGFRWTDSDVASGERILMQANYGHVAMAALGAAAFILMKNTKVIDGVAAVSLKFDRIETALINKLKAPWEWFKSWRSPPNKVDTSTASSKE